MVTLAQWCHDWVKAQHGAWHGLEARLTPLHLRTRILPHLGYLSLDALSPGLLAHHAAVRVACGVPVSSVDAEMRLLGRVLAAAVDAGHIDVSPAITVHEPVVVAARRPGDVPDHLDPSGGVE